MVLGPPEDYQWKGYEACGFIRIAGRRGATTSRLTLDPHTTIQRDDFDIEKLSKEEMRELLVTKYRTTTITNHH